MADPVNCPDCNQRVGVKDDKIVSHQPSGSRETCSGSGKAA